MTDDLGPVSLNTEERAALRELRMRLAARAADAPRLLIADTRGGDSEEAVGDVAALASALAAAAQLFESDQPVAILPLDRELTTTQAARLLRVSRQYLARLLDAGAIPYRKVGTHHRLRVGDLYAFKERQRTTIAEMARISEELGLYDE